MYGDNAVSTFWSSREEAQMRSEARELLAREKQLSNNNIKFRATWAKKTAKLGAELKHAADQFNSDQFEDLASFIRISQKESASVYSEGDALDQAANSLQDRVDRDLELSLFAARQAQDKANFDARTCVAVDTHLWESARVAKQYDNYYREQIIIARQHASDKIIEIASNRFI